MEFGPILRAMGRNKMRFGLIVVEVALTLAIVANCVGLILDTRRELSKESGFDDDHLLSVRSTPFDKKFRDEQYIEQSIAQDLALLRGLPGVAAASNTPLLPWQGGGSSGTLKEAGTQNEPLRTQFYGGDDGTLDTLGVAIIEGRNLAPEDVQIDPNASSFNVVISKAYADLLFPEGGAVGKALQGARADRAFRIVGVFDKFYNPYAWNIGPYGLFSGTTSGSYAGGTHYLVRVERGAMTEVLKALEERMIALDDGRNVRVQTIAEVKGNFQRSMKTVVLSLNIVIGLLVFVTAVGIVGLTAFSVTERTRQIGTRRALGARRVDVLRYFLLENWILTSLGISLGLIGAYALNMVLVTFVDGARMDWRLLAAGVAILWATGFGAALGPAMRATRIPPAIATRNV
ncbi:MAG TPA: FtsX-like permease family protein [Candidatus Polarisedimenticolia bacterium]|nr:FtsX-like permease family protein [Candidatus Polarisedimenticolia bacterium]